MLTKHDRQKFLRFYRDKTGERELDMRKVATLAKGMGWKMPRPKSDIELLAEKFADAAQSEMKMDDDLGQPYRVYHAIPVDGSGQMNLFVYVDIDEASRNQMLKSAVHRREQMVSEGVKLTNDLDHWNRVNPDKDPIQLPMDLAFDIAIRKAADEGDEEKAA
ncbi:MAG: hypothetical protein WAM52_05970 [Steroidobacteraceae bacterium]